MKKIKMFIFVLLIVTLSACSSENEIMDNDFSNENDEIRLTADDVPERKIIYTVDATYDVRNLSESVETLKGLLNSDEWFDSEYIGSSRAEFTLRIKTDRLDIFTELVKDEFQVRSFSKQGRDVSLQYQDKTNRITSINLQITRLQELYEEASLSDMITINSQLASLEVELMRLQGELSVFDSLVDYSEVNITLYGSTIISRSPFFNRLGNGFVNGFIAVVSVLDGLAIALVSVIPFIAVFGPIGYGGYLLRKKYMLKKKPKETEEKDKS
jgi:hypothetical protein